MIPSNDPSSPPSLSQVPSMHPSNTRNPSECLVQDLINTIEGYDPSQKTCKMNTNLDVTIERRSGTDSNRMLQELEESLSFLSLLGSYGTSNGEHDGSFDQDYEGGAFVSDEASSELRLVGNAWKAFELQSEYRITKKTRVSFDFKILREAQGHAICFDNNLNEDTFGGTQIRCLMLAGKQFATWKHIQKLDLAQIELGLGLGEVTQSSTLKNAGCEAENAVDGILRQEFVSISSSLNSIACTDPEIEPWWQFRFLNDEFFISEAIIHIGRNFPGSQNTMSNFRVSVCGNSTASSSSMDHDCTDGLYLVGESIIHEDSVGQDGVVAIPVNRSGRYIRITLQGNSKRSLGLAEVQILGTMTDNEEKHIDVNVFDLMPTQDAVIRYVAFIQDDDEFPQLGDIPLHEGAVMSQ
jgi:hypothetical protein